MAAGLVSGEAGAVAAVLGGALGDCASACAGSGTNAGMLRERTHATRTSILASQKRVRREEATCVAGRGIITALYFGKVGGTVACCAIRKYG